MRGCQFSAAKTVEGHNALPQARNSPPVLTSMLGASKVPEAAVAEGGQQEEGGQQGQMMLTWTAGLSRAKQPPRLPEQLPSLQGQQTSLLEPMILISLPRARLHCGYSLLRDRYTCYPLCTACSLLEALCGFVSNRYS